MYDLASRFHPKDEREERIKSCLPMCYDFAHRYAWTGFDLEDLMMAGVEGLIRAADKFDPKRKIKFVTLAWWHIRSSIQECARKTKRQQPDNVFSFDREASGKPTGNDGWVPSRDRGDLEGNIMSDAKLINGKRVRHGVIISHDNKISLDMHDMLRRLPGQEKAAVAMKYLEGKTQRDIGRALGVSSARAREILQAATARLRRSLKPETAGAINA